MEYRSPLCYLQMMDFELAQMVLQIGCVKACGYIQEFLLCGFKRKAFI